jgi:hypothetical protein
MFNKKAFGIHWHILIISFIISIGIIMFSDVLKINLPVVGKYSVSISKTLEGTMNIPTILDRILKDVNDQSVRDLRDHENILLESFEDYDDEDYCNILETEDRDFRIINLPPEFEDYEDRYPVDCHVDENYLKNKFRSIFQTKYQYDVRKELGGLDLSRTSYVSKVEKENDEFVNEVRIPSGDGLGIPIIPQGEREQIGGIILKLLFNYSVNYEFDDPAKEKCIFSAKCASCTEFDRRYLNDYNFQNENPGPAYKFKEGPCSLYDNCEDFEYEEQTFNICDKDNDGDRDYLCIGVCNLPKASALIVKIDTEEENTQVWDFRLTNDKSFDAGDGINFKLDDFDHPNSGQECVVFAIEEGPDNDDDTAQVWYVKPGSLIEKRDVGRLWDGLLWDDSTNAKFGCRTCSGSESGDFCVSRCDGIYEADKSSIKASPNPEYSTYIPTSYDPEDDDYGKDRNTIGGEWYTTFSKGEGNDRCGNRCLLLETSSGSGRKHWKPESELLCDDEGYWNVCIMDAITADANGIKYECEDGKWINGPQKKAIGTRILHVKIDPSDSGVEKWAFHLTDDEQHPMDDILYAEYSAFLPLTSNQRGFRDSFDLAGGVETKVCNVYSVNEEGYKRPDHLSTWYILPGGRIMTWTDANDMLTGIEGKIHSFVLNPDLYKGRPTHHEGSDDTEEVGVTPYSSSTDNNKCGSKYHPCNLLGWRGTPSDYVFVPKYELLCDNEGYWKVCESYVDETIMTADGVSYMCGQNDHLNWIWGVCSDFDEFKNENPDLNYEIKELPCSYYSGCGDLEYEREVFNICDVDNDGDRDYLCSGDCGMPDCDLDAHPVTREEIIETKCLTASCDNYAYCETNDCACSGSTYACIGECAIIPISSEDTPPIPTTITLKSTPAPSGSSFELPPGALPHESISDTEGWKWISVTQSMVDEERSIADMAGEDCGGPKGGWISYGWIYNNLNGRLFVVAGTDEDIMKTADPGEYPILEIIPKWSVGTGLWLKVTQDNCVLT